MSPRHSVEMTFSVTLPRLQRHDPLDPRVFEAMKPYFLEEFGNAGSRTHVYGQRAKEAVETARGRSRPSWGPAEEVIFTSGATESNNLALLGLVPYGLETGRRHVLSTAIEHKAVLEPLDQMSRLGFEVELAPVTPGGYVEPETIRQRLRHDTLLVSVMHANNETGVLQPIEEIGEILAGSETFFHTDAAQPSARRSSRCEGSSGTSFPSAATRSTGRRASGRLAFGEGADNAGPWRRSCLAAVRNGASARHAVGAADRRPGQSRRVGPCRAPRIGGSVRQGPNGRSLRRCKRSTTRSTAMSSGLRPTS